MKNIPIPNRVAYTKTLIDKTEALVKRMRWKAFFYENPNVKSDVENSYGFGSEKTPPTNPGLKQFESELFDIVGNIEFTKFKSEFQRKLCNDVKTITDSPCVYVPADKTTNMYKMSPDEYRKLVHNSVTAKYKKADGSEKLKIDREAASIAKNLKLQDRIECLAERDSFITLKDHKDNFMNNPKCRLINPAKTEMGSISKQELQEINQAIRESSHLQQWRETKAVVDWFKDINDKPNKRFIQLDIEEFYPSITEELLIKALAFAKSKVHIPSNITNIIIHARKSLLFSNGETWKKSNNELFDVTMGSFDGAEVCELVGLYVLHHFNISFPNINFGLYRDDGLGYHAELPGPSLESTKKSIIQLFKSFGLNITITTNMHQCDFLDVTLNLNTGKFSPYRKPNDHPLYINKQSNHPSIITNQLPSMIQRRISDLSSSQLEFDSAVSDYQQALSSSGYKEKLEYTPATTTEKRVRVRKNISWYNPPYSESVTTNLGHKFLSLINKCFPKNHKLHPIFNKNTIKLSYSCTPNMGAIISSHNKKLLSQTDNSKSPKTCSCRKKTECPLNNECLSRCIVYKATVKTENSTKEYIGGTEPTFKERLYNHNGSFNTRSRRCETKLSEYIWECKDKNEPYEIKWSIVSRTFPYKCGTRKCDLCLTEKYYILKSNKTITLNKRSEIANKCRHRSKFKLGKVR